VTARGILELTAGEWRAALDMTAADTPAAVIVEGSWWREQRTRWRLGQLENVRELKFPDIFVGDWRGRRVAFCCAYGAARTAEIIQLFGVLGTRLAVQIGTCGGLQADLRPGEIVVPATARMRDGVAQLYGSGPASSGTAETLEAARTWLSHRGLTVHDGDHLTWPTLFAQDARLITEWAAEGLSSVDMETATTYAVAARYGMASASLLVVWDALTEGRSFLDPLTTGEQRAVDGGNAAVFEAALALVEAG
jgi:uridine phosphorylase